MPKVGNPLKGPGSTGDVSTSVLFSGPRLCLLNEGVITALLLLSTLMTTPDGAPARKGPVFVAPTVCDAVTRQQVEAAFERRVWLSEWKIRSSQDRCDYEIDGGKVTIRMERTPSKLVPSREFEELRKAFPEARAQEFMLGNAPSMLLELPSTGAQVFAIPSSNQYILVSILGFGDSARVSAAARRLTLGALERLGL